MSTLDNYDEESWVISQTVASWISVLGVAIALLAVLQERITKLRSRDTGRTTSDPTKMGFFYVKGVPGISALLGESNEACMLTTIRGLIVAGDMGLWTSAAVDQLTMSHGEIYWVALYKSVFRMVVEGDHDRTRKFGRPVDGFLERAREEIEMEKRKHAKDLADWNADARRLVDSRLRDASQEPVSGAQEKTHNPEEEDLERRRVPPTRTQLYEISSDNIIPRNTPAPSIASSQPFSSLLTSMRSIFRIPLPPSFGSHEMDSEISSEMKISSNMPENCAFIKTVNLNTIPRPRLVNCVRPIDRRYKSPASIPCATCITETSPGPNKGTSVNPRSNFGRTFSSGTVTNNSTSSSSKLVQTPMRIMHALFGPATCTPDDDYSTSSYDGEVNVPSRSNSKTQDISGLNDLRKAWSIDQKPYVEISREELAALALVLGMQLKINDFTASISGIGGFGTSLTASQAGGYWKVNLVHGSRTLSQRNNRGSGYVYHPDGQAHRLRESSVLDLGTCWVFSVFVTNEVVVAIKKGRHIQDNQGHGDSSLEYLRRLPSARQIDAFYGSKEPRKVDYFTSDVNKSNYEYPQGTILRADGGPVSTTPNCTWQRAVAGIAFGGLVPQASTHLVEAVTFTVGGSGQNCLKELELLINTLHTVDTESEVFGPYVAHRSVNGGLGSENIDFSPYPRRNPRDGAAIFGRYMNLVERIVARCEATSPGNPVEAVFEALCRLIDSTYHTAVEINQANSSREQALQDLGKIVQDVRLGLDNNSPISVQNCAQILRIILAAWAEQVACVEMKLDPEECRNRSHRGAEALVGYFANRVATLEDLPAVSALG